MPVVFYDSLKEFTDSLPDPASEPHDGGSARGFNGHQTYKQATKNLWNGDNRAVKRSEELLDKMEAEGMALNVSYWDNDRTGFIPCVPSFLAGSPDSMRRLMDFQTDVAPIKVFASVCLSAGFEASQLETRGVAILALVRKLALIRPVELCLYADLDGKDTDGRGKCAIPVIKIDTSPLDLTSVSYAIANAGFLRQLCFTWGYDGRGYTGGWACGEAPQHRRAWTRDILGAKESDLIIDGAYLTDELMREPLKWVNDQVKRYTGNLEEINA